MEAVITQTLALLVACGVLISFAQERWLSRLDGQTAFVANVVISLGFGIAGTFKSGFLGMLPAPADLWSFALNVLATSSVIVAASKAAFEWLTKRLR